MAQAHGVAPARSSRQERAAAAAAGTARFFGPCGAENRYARRLRRLADGTARLPTRHRAAGSARPFPPVD